MKRFTPASRAASSMFWVPVMFDPVQTSICSCDGPERDMAAQCSTPSMPAAALAQVPMSRISPSMNSHAAGIHSRLP